jgi:O-antigen ligase
LGAIFDYFTVYSNIRAITSFGRGVFLTQYLTMVIPLLFAFTIFSKRILLSLASAVTFFLLTLFLIWNISRAAILSVIIAIFCIYFIKNRRNAIILLISILGLIIFLIFIYALPRFKSFDKFLDPALRPIRWESALRIVKDYPVFGSGLGTIELIYADYAPILKDKGPHVHNTFLEVAAEMGLVGLVAFMLIFIVLFKKFFNFVKGSTGTEDPDKFAFATGVFGGILATLVLSLSCTVITVGVNNATLFWFLLGALASIIA